MNPPKIIRSRRKTLALEISQKGVLLRSPIWLSESKIWEFWESKKKWAEEKSREFAKKIFHLPIKTFEEGEQFLFLGESYPLIFSPVPKEDKALCLHHNQFLIDQNVKNKKQKFEYFYRKEAKKLLSKKTEEYAKIMNLSYKSIRITSAKTRWGSCNHRKKTLNFPWRLILLPEEAIDSVVVHELCHLVHPNHSPLFWTMVREYFPTYKKSQEILKEKYFHDFFLPFL